MTNRRAKKLDFLPINDDGLEIDSNAQDRGKSTLSDSSTRATALSPNDFTCEWITLVKMTSEYNVSESASE